MFKCYDCEGESTHFCEKSEVTMCNIHASEHIKEGCKENLLTLSSPLASQYSKILSCKLQLHTDEIRIVINKLINSISIFRTQQASIEKNIINALFTLRNAFSNQMKRIFKKDLTMKEANEIFQVELNIDIGKFDRGLNRLKKSFTKLSFETNEKILAIINKVESINKANFKEKSNTVRNRKNSPVINPGILKNELKSGQELRIKRLEIISSPRTIELDDDELINEQNFSVGDKKESKLVDQKISYKGSGNKPSSVVLSPKVQMKKVKNTWKCACGDENDEIWEVCSNCYNLKPGVEGWVCKQCKVKNTSESLFKCSVCGEINNESPKSRPIEEKRIYENKQKLDNQDFSYKKGTNEEIKIKIWECGCGASNDDKWDVCNKCEKIKPGLKGWVCSLCKLRNESQSIVKCKGCNNYKSSKIGMGQDYWICKACGISNSLTKSTCDKCFEPCKKNEKLELSLGALNTLSLENERNCLTCRTSLENSSLEISLKTEKNNEELWTCACGTRNSNDKITCENCTQKPQQLISINKGGNFMLKTIEKNQKTLDLTPNSMGQSKEHTLGGKNTRLRSNSSHPHTVEEHKEIKKPCLENESLWKCLICYKFNDEDNNKCSYCYNDKALCLNQRNNSKKPWVCYCRYENILDTCIKCGKTEMKKIGYSNFNSHCRGFNK